MVTINYGGRLGNNMIQYSAAKLFSKKHKIKLVTQPINGEINFTELLLPTNDEDHKINQYNTLIVNNNNFLSLLESQIVEDRHYVFSDYFQIENFFSNYNNEIRKLYKPCKEKKQGTFVHYRIGDIVNSKNMLPLNYYLEALNRIGIKGGYIASDTPNHPNVITLSNQFGLEVFNDNPINTIDLGSRFNNIVLSEGTFSWWIGHLSNAKNIFFNRRIRFWHGEIFTNKDWIGLHYD